MVKISGFTDEYRSNLDKQIELIKELNMKYMCPRNINGTNIADYTLEAFNEQVKPKLVEAGIKFSSIGSPIGKVNLDDEEAYKAQLKKLEELVKIAKSMDCKYIRVFSFYVDKNGEYANYSAKVMQKMKGFLKLVEGTDIILLHENEKGIYGDTPSRALEIYHSMDSPNFKLCYDASNYIQCGVNPFDAYEQTRDWTVYYHMKDCTDGVEVPLGTGQGRIEDILADLKVRNYQGFFTMEPHTAKYALTRRLFTVLPFLYKAIKNSRAVFKQIDKDRGIRRYKRVTRKDVFIWQYENLTSLLQKVGFEFE